jgi:hypothetical protein
MRVSCFACASRHVPTLSRRARNSSVATLCGGSIETPALGESGSDGGWPPTLRPRPGEAIDVWRAPAVGKGPWARIYPCDASPVRHDHELGAAAGALAGFIQNEPLTAKIAEIEHDLDGCRRSEVGPIISARGISPDLLRGALLVRGQLGRINDRWPDRMRER